jgi:hypothetical protein
MVLNLLFISVSQGVSVQTRNASEFLNIHDELSSPPFWKRPLLWKEMQVSRKIPVSVIHLNGSRWSFKGAGLATAPREFCFEKAKDFDRLRQIPEHFKEVSYDEKNSTLNLRIQFLGRERKMHLQLSEEILKGESRLYFRTRQGWLPGLEGVLQIKDDGRQGAEIGIQAFYPGKIPWVPDWLFSVAAEGVMHHVAESLRKSLETDYKNERGESIGVQRN